MRSVLNVDMDKCIIQLCKQEVRMKDPLSSMSVLNATINITKIIKFIIPI